MTFPVTQLGRFGGLCKDLLTGIPGGSPNQAPDMAAALSIAADAKFHRPGLAQVLKHKGFVVDSDPKWIQWSKAFEEIVRDAGLPILDVYTPCPKPVNDVPAECCPHALTPPQTFGTLRCEFLSDFPDNIYRSPDGRLNITKFQFPKHLFVVLEAGEILVGLEENRWFKHPSLAGGRPVWTAGEFGIEKGKICVADLSSGHYVKGRDMEQDQLPRERLTQQIFKSYCEHFDVRLHRDFWISQVKNA